MPTGVSAAVKKNVLLNRSGWKGNILLHTLDLKASNACPRIQLNLTRERERERVLLTTISY